MKLKDGYNGLTEEYINSMSEEQMRKVLLRLINTESEYSANWYPTEVYIQDDLADILRDRV